MNIFTQIKNLLKRLLLIETPVILNNATRFSIANDFSKFPAGRTCIDGPFSGTALRERLRCLLQENEKIEVDLDGTMGYSSSFLEEAFTGLFDNDVVVIAQNTFYDNKMIGCCFVLTRDNTGRVSLNELLRMVLKSTDWILIEEIKTYIKRGVGDP